MIEINYRREDGTYVASINGLPYHVTPETPYWDVAQEIGKDAPFEPTFIPEPKPATIPKTISRFQARAALLSAGILSDVEAAVAAAEPFSQLAWAEAQEWRRDSPTLLALAHGIGLTDAEIDDLFIQAAAIRA